MEAINYRQLQLARESRSLTQTNLAKRIANLSQSNLSKMEKGLLSIPEDTLKRIADELKYPLSFFYKNSQRTQLGEFYYRKRISLSKTNLMAIEAKRDIIRLAVDELLQSVEVKECLVPQIRVEGDTTPSDIARKIRSFFKLPKGPIGNFIEILENAGIIVYEMDFDSDKFMGFTVHTDKGQPIIFLNKNMPNDRKRFTLGHELGHLVMHIPFDLDEDEKTIEQQANEFSSEFSMPLLDCMSDIQRLRLNDLGNLKTYWKLSKSAIIMRALTAKYLTTDRYQYYMIELSRMGERKNERGFVDIDKPTLLKQMINMHINDLSYTKEELAQMIGLYSQDFAEYFFTREPFDLRLQRRIL